VDSPGPKANLRKKRYRDVCPPQTELEKIEWPLERLAFRFLWLLLLFCPFWVAIDRRESKLRALTHADTERFNISRRCWVLGWWALLVGLWFWNPGHCGFKTLAAVLAALRLVEIFTTALGTVLEQAQQVGARNLVTIGIYVVQVMLIFAILYHSLATSSFVSDVNGSTSTASRPSDYLYISWSALTTVGNSVYVPINSMARYLSVLTTTFGALLLGVLLAFGINSINEGKGPPGAADGSHWAAD
jgi:hypothetical protein